MSDLEANKKVKEKHQSWTSHLILPCPDSGSDGCTSSCAFNKGKGPHQHGFTVRIVPPSEDSRSLLPIAKGVLFNNLEAVPFHPDLDPEPEACFQCRGKGHTYKKCKKPEAYKFCINCGRRDVKIRKCPRCAKEYKEFEKRRGRPSRSDDPVRRRSKSRGRSRGRAKNTEDEGVQRGRARSVGAFDSRNLRDKSRGGSGVPAAWIDTRSNAAPTESKGARNERGKPKNVGFVESKGSRDKSSPREWNLPSAGFKNNEEKNREEGNPVGDANIRDDEEKSNKKDEKLPPSDEAAAKDFTSEILEFVNAIKRLPEKTQNVMVQQFMEKRRAMINRGAVKLE